MASWNSVKEAVRALKGQMSKNARNTAKYQKKKERGPVKAFFHITKNENIPAIEQQGLLTNHPNANINSANHPFRKHGTDAGGVWVTTEPTAFPVYGTTIGGKNGNASARADALSTIKIEVPLPELAKMKAVQDPYGENILRKGNDPRAIQTFPTWSGESVPTTVLLNDIKPEWLKNIGYVEEASGDFNPAGMWSLLKKQGSWELPSGDTRRMLNKADFRDASGVTGHGTGTRMGYLLNKTPGRFVEDYLNRNHPITDRLPIFPKPEGIGPMANKQTGHSPNYIFNENDELVSVPANELKRYSVGVIPVNKWTTEYKDYVKPGESVNKQRTHEFVPGAISRGIGGRGLPPIKKRNFNWDAYNRGIARNYIPAEAASDAFPDYALDWDNIVLYGEDGYGPRIVKPNEHAAHYGAVSRGSNNAWLVDAQGETILNGDEELQQIKRIYENKEYRRDLRDALAEQQVIRDGKTTLNKNATWKDILRAWIDYRFDPNM